jgi:hypothetical protein
LDGARFQAGFAVQHAFGHAHIALHAIELGQAAGLDLGDQVPGGVGDVQDHQFADPRNWRMTCMVERPLTSIGISARIVSSP